MVVYIYRLNLTYLCHMCRAVKENPGPQYFWETFTQITFFLFIYNYYIIKLSRVHTYIHIRKNCAPQNCLQQEISKAKI